MKLTWRYCITIFIMGYAACVAGAQRYDQDAHYLYSMARELWSPIELQFSGYPGDKLDNVQSEKQLRQALVYLEAAVEVSPSYAPAWYDLFHLRLIDPVKDEDQAAQALMAYSELQPEDSRVVDKWVTYQLAQRQSRYSREDYLKAELPSLANYPKVASDVMTQLGIMALETGDGVTAQQYFTQAFIRYPSNVNVLSRRLHLSKPQGEMTSAIWNNENLNYAFMWRYYLANNPADFSAAVNLIDRLQMLGAYKLCQRFFQHAYMLTDQQDHLAQSKTDLQMVQLGFAYAAQDNDTCLELIDQLASSKHNQLYLQALKGGVLKRTGNETDAKAAVENVQAQLAQLTGDEPAAAQLALAAWFYAFIQVDPQRALEYAELAYQTSTDAPNHQALYAYSLMLTNRWDQLEPLQDTLAAMSFGDALAALCAAQQFAHDEDYETALQTLRRIPRQAVGVFIDGYNRLEQEIITNLDSDQIEPDTSADFAQRIADTFDAEFDDKTLAWPSQPDKFIRCALRLKSGDYSFAAPLTATIFLTNLSQSTIYLGPEKWLDPVVVVCGSIQPSDKPSAQTNWQPLTQRYLMIQPSLDGGRSHTIEESLNLGPIKAAMYEQPQRSFDIQFKTVLEPIINDDGTIQPRRPSLKSPPAAITRKGFYPDSRRMNYYQTIMTDGKPDQVINATRLLAGLIREAWLAKQGKLDYPVRPIDSKRCYKLLLANLKHNDFRIRAWTAYELRRLPLSPNSQATAALVKRLNDPHWFVRLMAMTTLDPLIDLQSYYQSQLQDDTLGRILREQIMIFANLPQKDRSQQNEHSPLTNDTPQEDKSQNPNGNDTETK